MAAIDEKNYDIDNINIELNTFMAGQKRAYENWKKMKFRLLIISKFSSFKALQKKLDDPDDEDDDMAEYTP